MRSGGVRSGGQGRLGPAARLQKRRRAPAEDGAGHPIHRGVRGSWGGGRSRAVGVGRVVEVFPFVVIPLGTDYSGASPGLDGVRVDAVGGGGLGEGEQALVTQPLAADGDAVGADDEPVEGLADAAVHAALVEDGELGARDCRRWM